MKQETHPFAKCILKALESKIITLEEAQLVLQHPRDGATMCIGEEDKTKIEIRRIMIKAKCGMPPVKFEDDNNEY